MKVAEVYARLSRAQRLKVGSVIIRDDRVISVGYNGTPSGLSNECELEGVTKPEVIHAEANAILFAAKNGISTDNCMIIITHSPCFECVKMIVQSGIKEVYYKYLYRDKKPLELLKQAGVKVQGVGADERVL